MANQNKGMKNLIVLLTENTQHLKAQYLDKTRAWARHDHKVSVERKAWSEARWCELFNLEPRWVEAGYKPEGGFFAFPKGFYSTQNSRDYRKLLTSAENIARIPIEEYLSDQKRKAVSHYEASIEKLSTRILAKGLNLENLTVEDGSVGVNINTVISDGVKRVVAQTIIASGEVQRPHYRYLVK
jgi:hypothetical protein